MRLSTGLATIASFTIISVFAFAGEESSAGKSATSMSLATHSCQIIVFSPSSKSLLGSVPYAEPFVVSAAFPKGSTEYFGVSWSKYDKLKSKTKYCVRKPSTKRSGETGSAKSDAPRPIDECLTEEEYKCPSRDDLERMTNGEDCGHAMSYLADPDRSTDAKDVFLVKVSELTRNVQYRFCYYYDRRLSKEKISAFIDGLSKEYKKLTKELIQKVLDLGNLDLNMIRTEFIRKFENPSMLQKMLRNEIASSKKEVIEKLVVKKFANEYVTEIFNRSEYIRVIRNGLKNSATVFLEELISEKGMIEKPQFLLEGGYTYGQLIESLESLAKADKNLILEVLTGEKELEMKCGKPNWVERKEGQKHVFLKNLNEFIVKNMKSFQESKIKAVNDKVNKVLNDGCVIARERAAISAKEELSKEMSKILAETIVSESVQPSIVKTRVEAHSIYASADVGIAYMFFGQGDRGPAMTISANIYFAPQDGNLSVWSRHCDWGCRLSVIFGITALLDSRGDGNIEGLLTENVSPVVGAGFRFTRFLRLSGGMTLAWAKDDPAQPDDKKLRLGGFFSLSLDVDIASIVKKAFEITKAE